MSTSTPQSPDLARSGRSAAEPKSAKARADLPPAETGPDGPVPAESAPGHHPDVEQDRPTGPPPRPQRSASKAAVRAGAKKAAAKKTAAKKAGPKKAAAKKAAPKAKKAPPAMRPPVPVTGGPAAELTDIPPPAGETAAVTGGPAADLVEAPGSVAPVMPLRSRNGRRPAQTVRFPFAFDRRMLPLSVLFGVVPMTSGVELDAEHLRIRFGPWKLTTPLANIAEVRVTGPYQLLRVAGPPRLSMGDGGITFGTSTGPGVCMAFRTPVPAALPVPLLRHHAATVTVLEPETFADTLRRRLTA